MKIARTYLKLDVRKLDTLYDYIAPENARVGERVRVPFGNGDREVVGFIVELVDESDYRGELKEISEVIDSSPILEDYQIRLARFLSERYFINFFTALSYFTAPKALYKNKSGRYVRKGKKRKNVALLNDVKLRGNVQKEVVDLLKKEGKLPLDSLRKKVPKASSTTIKRLKELGAIEVTEEETGLKDVKKNLNRVPERALLDSPDEDGLTDLIKSRLEGGQVLVVFPEIERAKRFIKAYNKKSDIKAFHYSGRLSTNEKSEVYKRVTDGSARVVIGSNAALFLPYCELDSIIIVDAGDESYLPSVAVHYDTLETAAFLSKETGANLYFLDLLDSLGLNSYLDRGYLDKRENETYRDLEILDISLLEGDEAIISPGLKKRIDETLEKGERVILFLNRKGYFNVLYCNDCGHTLRCPECDSIMRTRKSGRELNCRICDHSEGFDKKCPECGGEIVSKNFGVEKAVDKVKSLYPDYKVLSLSSESSVYEDSDILIATRFLLGKPKVKNVGLVAALNVDLDLNYPDFASPEWAYRIYSRLFLEYGNAHHLVQAKEIDRTFLKAISGESDTFILDQSEYRKLAKLPPDYDLYVFTLTADDAKTSKNETNRIRDKIESEKDRLELVVLPVNVVRIKRGSSSKRFLVKAKKKSGFEDFLHESIDNGLLDEMSGSLSILLNPSGVT